MNGYPKLTGREIDNILLRREPIDIGNHLSESDAFWEYWNSLTSQAKERERLLLLAISNSEGESTP
ncbi:MAG: hypothetical protein M3M85_02515 [bacterium]|nr:hypothetical protein [bacterium]